jgi:lipid-A-disaccharide synthase
MSAASIVGEPDQSKTPVRLFIVVGEHSGDALGAKLIAALQAARPGAFAFAGVGGEDMAAKGFATLFPIEDVAVMGPLNILPKLPRIVRRVYEAVDAAIAFAPDLLIIIDSPEFTHPIAKRIRKRAPHIPIIDYVSPSVWAWRPGRAKRMRRYVDEVLALLPFEPAAHARLGGPHCTYVGHPLIERLDEITNADGSELTREIALPQDRDVLLVLPGSRTSEVTRLMDVFGEALALLQKAGARFTPLIPAVPHVRRLIAEHARSWSIQPIIVDAPTRKYAAMRLARAALAASGTVTLELALAGTPTVVAYRIDRISAKLRFLLKVDSVVLANLVLGENVYPELLQEDCTAEKLAAALETIFFEGPERRRQLEGLKRVPEMMLLAGGKTPSAAAAAAALSVLDRASGR